MRSSHLSLPFPTHALFQLFMLAVISIWALATFSVTYAVSLKEEPASAFKPPHTGKEETRDSMMDCWKSKMLDVMMMDKYVGQVDDDVSHIAHDISVSIDRVLVDTWGEVTRMAFLHNQISEIEAMDLRKRGATVFVSQDSNGLGSLCTLTYRTTVMTMDHVLSIFPLHS